MCVWIEYVTLFCLLELDISKGLKTCLRNMFGAFFVHFGHEETLGAEIAEPCDQLSTERRGKPTRRWRRSFRIWCMTKLVSRVLAKTWRRVVGVRFQCEHLLDWVGNNNSETSELAGREHIFPWKNTHLDFVFYFKDRGLKERTNKEQTKNIILQSACISLTETVWQLLRKKKKKPTTFDADTTHSHILFTNSFLSSHSSSSSMLGFRDKLTSSSLLDFPSCSTSSSAALNCAV